jgi:hypothetical protein
MQYQTLRGTTDVVFHDLFMENASKNGFSVDHVLLVYC